MLPKDPATGSGLGPRMCLRVCFLQPLDRNMGVNLRRR